MTSRTIQTHNPSGETYVLEYDDLNIISALSEPLYHADAEALTADTLWDVEVHEDDALWANDQRWSYPVLTAEYVR